MSKPCNECPFLKATPLIGAPDWLRDVVKMHQKNTFFSHSCHQTDPRTEGYKGGKETRECAGHVAMMMNEMDGTPGAEGVYDSHKQLLETYLVEWLGEDGLQKVKQEKVEEALANRRRIMGKFL